MNRPEMMNISMEFEDVEEVVEGLRADKDETQCGDLVAILRGARKDIKRIYFLDPDGSPSGSASGHLPTRPPTSVDPPHMNARRGLSLR